MILQAQFGDWLGDKGGVKDTLSYEFSYRGVKSSTSRTINYNLYTTEGRARSGNISTTLNLRDNLGNNGDNLVVTAAWDARIIAMYLEIDSIRLEVEYAIKTGNNGTIYYYDL